MPDETFSDPLTQQPRTRRPNTKSQLPSGAKFGICQDALEEIIRDKRLSEGIMSFMDVMPMEKSLYAGTYVIPDAQRLLRDSLQRIWKDRNPTVKRSRGFRYREIIIGGGLHAAAYCAVRAQMGFEKPLVITQRIGGPFTWSKGPSYWLNSRNRSGPLSTPGRKGALNVIPGAPIQPADLSGEEYQDNSALAYVIELCLALYADVVIDEPGGFEDVGKSSPIYRVDCQSGLAYEGARLFWAVGLGEPEPIFKHERILTLDQLCARMDQARPLENMDNIAVIGAGDSGCTALMMLLGQGPRKHWSVASLGEPDIEWYGIGNNGNDRATFEKCVRGLYRGIGRFLPNGGNNYRVRPRATAAYIVPGYDQILVNERSYDWVIDCRGKYQTTEIPASLVPEELSVYRPYSRALALSRRDFYVIGPAANLGVSDSEGSYLPSLVNLEVNRVAAWRYVGRTAALASGLPI